MFKDQQRRVFSLDTEQVRKDADLAKLKVYFETLERSINPYKNTFAVLNVHAKKVIKALKDTEAKKVLVFGEDYTAEDLQAKFPNYFSGEYTKGEKQLEKDVAHRNEEWLPNMVSSIKNSARAQLFMFGRGHLQGDNGLIFMLAQQGIELRRFNSTTGEFKAESPLLFLGEEAPGQAFFTAMKNDNVELLKYLLKHFSPNSLTLKGWTPLHWATYLENIEMIDLLLRSPGIDVNQLGSSDKGALFAAVLKKNLFLFDYLLRAGADPHLKTQAGFSFLTEAHQVSDPNLKALMFCLKKARENDDADQGTKFQARQEVFIKGLQSVQGKPLNGNKATVMSFDSSKKTLRSSTKLRRV